ncbi:MAG TPA: BamA/TamA family outer membrane protein [Steroidobacteraceae bacterium]|nr:BamA/TamA family outer membrane protein [Steroidobacteraceae bacterium]
MRKFCIELIALFLALQPCYGQQNPSMPTTDTARLIVEDVQCRGNVTTSCDFIRDRLYVAIGKPVDDEEIGNAKLRLSSLPNFTAVNIYLEKGSAKGRVIVVIEVAEASPWTKELVVSTVYRDSVTQQRFAGRISNENLFGTGKVLSLEGIGVLPISGGDGSGYYGRLQYVDPRLLSTSKYFLIAGTFYEKVAFDYSHGTSLNHQYFGMDLTVGRRIFDFSYVTLGYRHLPTSILDNSIKQSDGSLRIENNSFRDQAILSYGWNTEDDPYFPTHGSRFETAVTWDPHQNLIDFQGGYRYTWNAQSSIWTLIAGRSRDLVYRQPLDRNFELAVSYARAISWRESSDVQRGRWYIEPGVGSFAVSSGGDSSAEIGIKAGVRLQSKTYGIVDLYFIASDTVHTGSNR